MTINTNRVIISGRLTSDPVLNKTKNEISVCTITIAVNNGDSKNPDYFPVVCWRGLAEAVCEYRKRGDGVLVDGKLHNRFYIDEENNVRKITEVTAENIEFTTTAKANELSDPTLRDDYKTQAEIDKILEACDNVEGLPF